jgi:hypothetical protein
MKNAAEATLLNGKELAIAKTTQLILLSSSALLMV